MFLVHFKWSFDVYRFGYSSSGYAYIVVKTPNGAKKFTIVIDTNSAYNVSVTYGNNQSARFDNLAGNGKENTIDLSSYPNVQIIHVMQTADGQREIFISKFEVEN